MKLTSLLKAEILKYKRTPFWFFALLFPLGHIGMLFLDYLLRHDYLTSSKYLLRLQGIGVETPFDALLLENHLNTLWLILLPMAITFICGFVYHTENSKDTFKIIFAKPIEKSKFYFAKWSLVVCLTFGIIAINSLGVIFIAKLFKIANFNLKIVLIYTLYQTVVALGIISIQFWISSFFKNVVLSTGIGLTLSIFSVMLVQSEFIGMIIPYAYTSFDLANHNSWGTYGLKYIACGLISGLVYLILGMQEFKNRDIR